MAELGIFGAGLFLLAYAVWAIAMGRRAGSWMRSSGVIEKAAEDVVTGAGEDRGVRYSRLRVSYSYEVSGRRLVGSRVYFGQTLASHPGNVKRLLETYPPGRRVRVYVDPADPTRAVLEQGTHWTAWLLGALGASGALIGLVA